MDKFGWIAICGIVAMVFFIVGAGSFKPLAKTFTALEIARLEVAGGIQRSAEGIDRNQAEPASWDLPTCRQIWNAGYQPEAGVNCR